ncbi:hypothetical protein [Actinacidiphila bryophytorum]|uniref:hypothetical protein n=1 Tax=Actinacidiphila bryophytorum TaxID=1436133 RepID=UPI002176D72F|nr:hypothetical protein [Actinacidiphila bryophytorum]UWE10633.1 hypothetical protein NYE86_19235 [Actinacidiphila bryophytorum]
MPGLARVAELPGWAWAGDPSSQGLRASSTAAAAAASTSAPSAAWVRRPPRRPSGPSGSRPRRRPRPAPSLCSRRTASDGGATSAIRSRVSAAAGLLPGLTRSSAVSGPVSRPACRGGSMWPSLARPM